MKFPKQGNGWGFQREPKHTVGSKESRRRGSELARQVADADRLFDAFRGNLGRYLHRIHAGKHYRKPRHL